jgi:hypothetical protein
MDFDAICRIQNPAVQIISACEPVNERTKSDALYNAAYLNRVSLGHINYFECTTQPRPCQPI